MSEDSTISEHQITPPDSAAPATNLQCVIVDYYNGKTASILQKYGPGPIVHFNLGLFTDHPTPVPDPDLMRKRLVASQAALMARAADVWNAQHVFAGEVLDVGCGLGGGAIYWAQKYGANVTAVTIAPEHLPVVARFAEEAGVGRRVRTILSDACEVPTDRLYDTAVAFESSCYFPRDRWFAHLARLIRPGGYVCVEEVFQRHPDGTKVWDGHYYTRAGSVQDYVRAAEAAGFVLDVNVDVTEQTPEFWIQSIGWIDAMLGSGHLGRSEEERLKSSRRLHVNLHQEWLDGGCEHRLLRFHHRTKF